MTWHWIPASAGRGWQATPRACALVAEPGTACSPPRSHPLFSLWRAHREAPEARAPPDGGRARRLPEVPAVVLGAALCQQLQALDRKCGFPRRSLFLLPASPSPPPKSPSQQRMCLFTLPDGGRRQWARRGPRAGSHLSAPHSAGERRLLSVTWRAGLLTSTHSQAGTLPPCLPVSASVALDRLGGLPPWLDTFWGD